MSNNQQVFFELVRAGLWEKEAKLAQFHGIDFSLVMHLAESQSLVGLIAAGLEHVSDTLVPKEDVLQFVGQTIQLEQRNKEMNGFVGMLFYKLQLEGLYPLLVKGQGIAQCYERPLWRACGDVDLLLYEGDYEKAKKILAPFSDYDEPEVVYRMHKAYNIKGFEVELHGKLRGSFLKRVDRVVDEVQKEVFEVHRFRTWKCGETEVHLPSVDSDILFVFTHILQHFFIEGIGLRQICDWCRLLWTYRNKFDVNLLYNRLREMGMLTEWKAFGAMAVDYLGMPADAMPFYTNSPKWQKKATRIMSFVLETGNFGHNRNTALTYKYPFLFRKTISLFRHTSDGFKYLMIFPVDAIIIWFEMIAKGIRVLIKGA